MGEKKGKRSVMKKERGGLSIAFVDRRGKITRSEIRDVLGRKMRKKRGGGRNREKGKQGGKKKGGLNQNEGSHIE